MLSYQIKYRFFKVIKTKKVTANSYQEAIHESLRLNIARDHIVSILLEKDIKKENPRHLIWYHYKMSQKEIEINNQKFWEWEIKNNNFKPN